MKNYIGVIVFLIGFSMPFIFIPDILSGHSSVVWLKAGIFMLPFLLVSHLFMLRACYEYNKCSSKPFKVIGSIMKCLYLAMIIVITSIFSVMYGYLRDVINRPSIAFIVILIGMNFIFAYGLYEWCNKESAKD